MSNARFSRAGLVASRSIVDSSDAYRVNTFSVEVKVAPEAILGITSAVKSKKRRPDAVAQCLGQPVAQIVEQPALAASRRYHFRQVAGHRQIGWSVEPATVAKRPGCLRREANG